VTRSHSERVDALLHNLLDELGALKQAGLPSDITDLAQAVAAVEDSMREFITLSRIVLAGP
jgi:hypothetical protein